MADAVRTRLKCKAISEAQSGAAGQVTLAVVAGGETCKVEAWPDRATGRLSKAGMDLVGAKFGDDLDLDVRIGVNKGGYLTVRLAA